MNSFPRLKHLLAAALLVATSAARLHAADAFAFKDEPGQHLDILANGKLVARYMYAYDKSTPAKLLETYKPYLHVFDAEGTAPITKGPGGTFPHHRGIYIGWNKITFNGKAYDRWHMKGGEQVHQKFTAQKADADLATFTSLVHWNDEAGKEFVVEERTMTFRPAPAPGRALIDFSSKLSAPRGEVKLDGDPEHAGIHFRPVEEVDKSQTVYVFPSEKPNAHKDVDYPWVGATISVRGKLHSVVEMSHPGNPKGTRWSAYRDYGRFGAFPTATIKSGESVTFNYRFLIAEGEMPAADVIQKTYNAYAGTTDPTPKVTAQPAEGAGKKAAPPKKK